MTAHLYLGRSCNHFFLERSNFIFFFLFASGVQESKSHSSVLGQGDVGSFSCCQALRNFGGFWVENSFGVLEWGLDSASEARKGNGALQLVIRRQMHFLCLSHVWILWSSRLDPTHWFQGERPQTDFARPEVTSHPSQYLESQERARTQS